jgi:hypothetical protein
MTTNHARFFSSPDWLRVGRGKLREIDRSAEHFAQALDQVGNQLDIAVKLIACRRVPDGLRYRPDYRILDPLELPRFVDEGWWQFFVWCPARGPEISGASAESVTDATLSLSGLVNIQCGRRSRGAVCASSIGVLSRIRNQRTGSEVALEDYQDVYALLSKLLLKSINRSA